MWVYVGYKITSEVSVVERKLKNRICLLMKEKNIAIQDTTKKLQKSLKRLADLELNLSTLFRVSSRSTQSRVCFQQMDGSLIQQTCLKIQNASKKDNSGMKLTSAGLTRNMHTKLKIKVKQNNTRSLTFCDSQHNLGKYVTKHMQKEKQKI